MSENGEIGKVVETATPREFTFRSQITQTIALHDYVTVTVNDRGKDRKVLAEVTALGAKNQLAKETFDPDVSMPELSYKVLSTDVLGYYDDEKKRIVRPATAPNPGSPVWLADEAFLQSFFAGDPTKVPVYIGTLMSNPKVRVPVYLNDMQFHLGILASSLPHGMPIIYKKSGAVLVDKIGNMVDSFYGEEDSGTPIPVDGMEVISLDTKTRTASWAPVQYVYRHEYADDLVKLVLETGRMVETTPNHSIYAFEGGRVACKNAAEIHTGDYIVGTMFKVIPDQIFNMDIRGRDEAIRFADSPVAFFRVETVERVKSRSRFVYDVSVPSAENFLAGVGGVFCHNTRAGKCLTRNSRILVSDGSYKEIGDLAASLKDGESIVSLNEDMKTVRSRIVGIMERPLGRDEAVYRLSLRSGRYLDATAEHPLLSFGGWVPLSSLKNGDRVAVPRGLPVFGDHEIPEEMVKIGAYLISEGCLLGSARRFSNTDPVLVQDFCGAVESLSPRITVSHNPDRPNDYAIRRITVAESAKKVNGEQICVLCSKETSDIMKHWERERKQESSHNLPRVHTMRNNDPIYFALKKWGLRGKGSKQKFVPNEIFTLKKPLLSLFLNRLFSGDGSAEKDKKRIQVSYVSESERLVCDVQHLLLRFGILSFVRKKFTTCNGKKFKSFELTISNAKNTMRFSEEIGFFGEKSYRLRKNMHEMWSGRKLKDDESNFDTVPKAVWHRLEKNPYTLLREQGNRVGKTFSSAFVLKNPHRVTLLNLVPRSAIAKRYALSDVLWDEVKHVRKIDHISRVYDIEVDNVHNFVANDIFVHNSYLTGKMIEQVLETTPFPCVVLDMHGDYIKLDTLQDGSKHNKFQVAVYHPPGAPIEDGITAKMEGLDLSPADMTEEQIVALINAVAEIGGLQETAILNAVDELKAGKKPFTLTDIISLLTESKNEKNEKDKYVMPNEDRTRVEHIVVRLQRLQKTLKLPSVGMSVADMLEPNRVSVICLAGLQSKVQDTYAGIILDQLFKYMVEHKKEAPPVFVFIEEAHRIASSTGKTDFAGRTISTIIREGAKFKIFLTLISQRPRSIDPDILANVGNVIALRITNEQDQQTILAASESFSRRLVEDLPRLNQGEAVVVGPFVPQAAHIQTMDRQTVHHGASADMWEEMQRLKKAKEKSASAKW